MSSFGEPVQLKDDSLPTELDVYHHFLYLNNVKCSSGDWKQITDLSVKAKCVRDDVAAIWDRSSIPHGLNVREGWRRISTIIMKGKKLNKVAVGRREEGFSQDMKGLFDVALCHHLGVEICTCTLQNKVQKMLYNF